MYLDFSDIGISRELILDGIREVSLVEWIKKELKEGDNVVDIGANIGYYTLLMSQLVGDKGKVYAIEPVPQNLRLLRKNIELNEYSNIEVHEHAIGDIYGFQSMYITKQCNRSTLRDVTGTDKEKAITDKIKVEVLTLDDFLEGKPYPNVIRMDLEGYEYQVIKGMNNTLQKRVPLMIFIEFHFHLLSKQETTEIFHILKNTGFRIAYISTASTIPGQRRHKLLSNIIDAVSPKIEEDLKTEPSWRRHLDLSINDILNDPIILSGQWHALQICFKRE